MSSSVSAHESHPRKRILTGIARYSFFWIWMLVCLFLSTNPNAFVAAVIQASMSKVSSRSGVMNDPRYLNDKQNPM
jgi:hypothetical protein